jgi:hypothetical protein
MLSEDRLAELMRYADEAPGHFPVWTDVRLALDDLTALRTENEKLREGLKRGFSAEYEADQALRTENERLTEVVKVLWQRYSQTPGTSMSREELGRWIEENMPESKPSTKGSVTVVDSGTPQGVASGYTDEGRAHGKP